MAFQRQQTIWSERDSVKDAMRKASAQVILQSLGSHPGAANKAMLCFAQEKEGLGWGIQESH